MNHAAYLKFEDTTSKVIVEEIYNPIHQMVHVIFEDGYENVFFTDIETGEWIEQDLGFTSLARAVGILVQDNSIEKFPIQKLAWFRESNTAVKPLHFGFLKYRSGNNTFYAIFAVNKRYMFTLFKNKHLWKVLSHTNLHSWNFDLDYFQEVPFLLDMYKL
jgi:hypothetical protein